MANSININDNGVNRQMTDEEFNAYKKITEEASSLIQAAKDAAVAKEVAVAKLVALGLTESDIRAVNS